LATNFSDLIIMLSGGINQRRLYFDEHPKVAGVCRDFVRQLEDTLAHAGETGFFFGVLGGKFVRNGKYLVGPSIAGRNIIQFSERLRCGGFLIRHGVSVEEIAAFFRLGATLNEKVENLQAAVDLFKQAGILNIDPSPHFREAGPADNKPGQDPARFDPGLIQFDFDDTEDGSTPQSLQKELEPLLPIFQTMYETVSNNNIQISLDREVDIARTLGVGEELLEISDRQTMDVMNLMRYPDYDSYTIGHSVRMSTLALTVAREMGWPKYLLTELATAALLHDVGKAKIPEEILYKPGLLTDEERRIAETHAAIGAQILLAKGDVSPSVIAGAWGHHIRHDGGGYPKVPGWVRRSPVASLLQVCDVFEALTAARPYKSPMPPRRAFEIILKDKAAFDPVPLAALVRAIGLYPPGSEVVLSTGCRAFVIGKGPSWEYPVVRIVSNPQGGKLSKDDQFVLRLHEEPTVTIDDFRMVELDVVEEAVPARTDH
jgi:putative nucleotidyltransferase with HDIG domain